MIGFLAVMMVATDVWGLFEKYGIKAGIEGKVHPSMLHHTFAGLPLRSP